MCVGAPCAVLVGNLEWFRAKILKFSKGNGVIVDLVDIGNDNIAKIENIRPLLKVFGRLPPLALRCRMKGVNMNDLTVQKVNEFQKLIKSCGDVVRVELANVSSIPFLVNLYHPTLQDENLGKLFYCRKGRAEREAARERRWNRKLAKMNDEFSTDCTSEEDSEDDSPLPSHILYLERLQKPITDEPLYISHIENCRFIYLHSEYHKKTIEKLEKELFTKWSQLKIVPEKWLIPALACAYSDISTCNPCRVIIAEIADQMVQLRGADHGWKKNVSKSDCLSGSLRLLTREFSETPLTISSSNLSSILGALMLVFIRSVCIIEGRVGCAKWRSSRITFGVKRYLMPDYHPLDSKHFNQTNGVARRFDIENMYLCCLPTSTRYHPHQSETDILRSILPVGTTVNIRRSPCKRSLPYKTNIFLENDESVIDLLERLRTEKRVIHPCFDLLPYKPSMYTKLYKLDRNYQEDLEVFRPFARGHLEYANF
ncbi:Tudor domain-containing [Dirofilaria immitis]